MTDPTWTTHRLQAPHEPVRTVMTGEGVAQATRHASADREGASTRAEIVDGVMRFIAVINAGIPKEYPHNAPLFCLLNKKFYSHFRALFEWFYFFEPAVIKAQAMTFSGRIGKILLQELDHLAAAEVETLQHRKRATDAVTAQLNAADTLEEKFLICARLEPALLDAQQTATGYLPKLKPAHWHPQPCWHGASRYLGLKHQVDRYVGWEARDTRLSSYDAYRTVKAYLLTLVPAPLDGSHHVA